MDAIRVVVQVAEATLSATSSKTAQRGYRPVILVIIAGIVVTTIIDNPKSVKRRAAEKKPRRSRKTGRRATSSGKITTQRANTTVRMKKRVDEGFHTIAGTLTAFIFLGRVKVLTHSFQVLMP
jgi:hypothetical protein